MNKYSEKLLSVLQPSVSWTEDILFGKHLCFEEYFEPVYSALGGPLSESPILHTYICLLAAMSDEDIQEFKATFK